MTDQFEGGCMCGEIRYPCNAASKAVYYCHCEDCRRGSGSAFHVGLVVPEDSLTVFEGSPKSFRKTADSGSGVTRQFCPNCGSPLFGFVEARPGFVVIKAGSLEQPDNVTPDTELWTDSKVSWANVGPDVESHPTGGLRIKY